MRDNKFDDSLRDKLRGFKAQPDEQVWERIEAELREKKRRRAIPVWWRLSGIAAALLLAVLGYYFFTGGHDRGPGPIVHASSPHDSVSPQSLQDQHPRRNDAVPVGEAVAGESEIGNHTLPTSRPSEENSGKPVDQGRHVLVPSLDDKAHIVSSGLATSDGNGKQRSLEPVSPPAHRKPGTIRRPTTQTAVAQNRTGNENAAFANVALQAVRSLDKRPKPENNNAMPRTAIAGKTEKNNAVTNGISERTPDMGIPASEEKNNGIAQTAPETKKDSTGLPANPNTLEELLKEKEKQVTQTEPKSNRWQVTTVVAPVYFSSASNGSPLDSRFEKNKKSYTPTLSYGVGAKYAVSKKLAVRAGVHTLKFAYNTSDLVFAQSASARRLENVTPNLQGSMIEIDNKPVGQQAILGRSGLGRSVSEYEGQVSQRIGYVEIPVEISYKILDRKFDVEVIGGVSTLVLNDNQVLLLSDGLQMPIGEADNLSAVHFSSNLGLGLRYSFFRSFQASVEPMLKYQFGTFSDNAGNFKPYLFGLYTGLSYKF